MISSLCSVYLTFVSVCVGKFIAPYPTFEAISPIGFRVYIPDIEGITLFGFHGSPYPINSREVGQWAYDATKPKDGRWIYTNRDVLLNIGDTIYFWTYVLYDGAGYRQEDGEWTVKSFVTENDKPPDEYLHDQFPNFGSTKPTPSTTEGDLVRMSKCEETASEVRGGGKICSGDLLFESNFNELKTFEGNWTPEVLFPEAPDHPFVVYMTGDHISLKGGHLTIKPIFLEERFGEGFTRKSLALESCTGDADTTQCKKNALGSQILPPIISGKLTTKNSFNFKYGRVEIQAKLPKGDWIVPELLLEPREQKYGSLNYASGFMKIASIKGNENYSGRLVGGIIMYDRDPFRKFGLKVRQGKEWNDDFHNYTFVWRPDEFSLYVDGDNYGNIKETKSFSEIGMEENIEAAKDWARGSKIAPFDQMFYISLGIRAGGVHDFSDVTEKPWKNKSNKAIVNFWKSRESWEHTWAQGHPELQVESVRVYAL